MKYQKKPARAAIRPFPAEKLILVHVTDAFEAVQFNSLKQQSDAENSLSINFSDLSESELGLSGALEFGQSLVNNLLLTDVFLYYPSGRADWDPLVLFHFLRSVSSRVWVIDRSMELEWCADRVYFWKKKWKSLKNAFD
ncbi:MAG TPA: hypothetical protein PKE06_02570 [Flavilitoribacter sp.]|nr:hypothetical protein [Flavilitoribacter sp.]HMQ86380.1 hypothetical protein [Flavilitoribacter sp.]